MGWSELIGTRLGRYEILEELGRGGSSRVYRAFDPERGGEVAVKVMPNDAEDRQRFVRRFRQEVEIVRQLHHPNIIEIYDSGQTDELVYLVMQYVRHGERGGTLRAYFGRALPLPRAIFYLQQMAFALHHAHERNIIHRDVKPSNMLVDADHPDHVLLTDFGIAKIQGHRGLTKSGTTIGTPEYMAPEQAEGREVDRRADIYSLGCVLYEALTGRPPFVGATPVSVLYQQVHSRPAYIRGFNPDVPLELARVVERALAKEPEDRFATAELFAYALQPFLHESQRVAANRMTEVWGGPSDVLREQGFTRSPEAPESTPESAAAELGSALLFQPSEQQADLDISMPPPPANGQAPGTPRTTPPLDEAQTRPPGERRPLAPSQPMRLPRRGTAPLPPDVAAPSRGGLGDGGEGLSADVDYSLLATAPPAFADTPPGQQSPVRPDPDITQLPTAPPLAALPHMRRRAVQGPRPSPTPALAPSTAAPPDDDEVSPTVAPPAWPGYAEEWEPTTDEIPTQAIPAPRRRRRAPVVIAVALAAVALAGVAALLGYTAYGARNGLGHRGGAPSPTLPPPTPTLAPTITPRPTVTRRPTATANPNAAITAQVTQSFTAITLTTEPDESCSAVPNSNYFNLNQTIYVNICMANQVAPGTLNIYMRQGGTILFPINTGQYLVAGGSLLYQAKLNEYGSFNILVTVTVQGQEYAARDLYFNVG